MIRYTSFVIAVAFACTAQAGTAQLVAAGGSSLQVSTEGLFDESKSVEPTRLVGFEFSAGDRLQIEAKAAFQQTVDPESSDGGLLSWAARLTPATLAAFGPRTTIWFEGAGQFDAAKGAYAQSLSSALEWTPAQPLSFLAGLQFNTELVRDGADGSITLKTTPEWIVSSQVSNVGEPMRTELKARVEYSHGSNAAPGLFAGLVFEIQPE